MRKAFTNTAAATVAAVAIGMFAAGGGQAAAPSQVDPCVSTTVEITTTSELPIPTVTPTPPPPTPTPTPPPGPARAPHGVDPCVTTTTGVGSGGGTIPETGNDSSPLATAGLVAVVLGVALLGVTVLRRTKPFGA